MLVLWSSTVEMDSDIFKNGNIFLKSVIIVLHFYFTENTMQIEVNLSLCCDNLKCIEKEHTLTGPWWITNRSF